MDVTRTPVVVSTAGAVHYGVMVGAVDEPPVVTAAGRSWYVEVWRARGWVIEADDRRADLIRRGAAGAGVVVGAEAANRRPDYPAGAG